MAERIYDHSQLGWIVMVTLGFTQVIFSIQYIFGLGSSTTTFLGYLCLSAVTFFIASLFYKLRVLVNESGIHLIYGIGLVKIHLKPDCVKSVRMVKNPWYYGMGIRIIPRGTLYNIQGIDAVEIIYEDGRRERMVRIGSDEVHILKAFLDIKYGLQKCV